MQDVCVSGDPMDPTTASDYMAKAFDLIRRANGEFEKGNIGDQALLAFSAADASAVLRTILTNLGVARPEKARVHMPVATPVGYEAGVPQF